MGANHDGPQMVTTYSQFIGMKPPTFTKAEETLDAKAWVRAIEATFSAFVLPCSEERKASFATLQLRGEALMWWERFKSMQPDGHEVTWTEFKKAFKDHHIPKGHMVRKMKELLALKQGDETVYQYAQKFNNLCQYGEHHVDTDAKKMEHFRDGLKSDLYERLNLPEPNSYDELVNKAIGCHDEGTKGQEETERLCFGRWIGQEISSRKLPRKWGKIPKHILKEYSIRSPLSQGTYPPIKEGLHPL
jgi:hypothetical protein